MSQSHWGNTELNFQERYASLIKAIDSDDLVTIENLLTGLSFSEQIILLGHQDADAVHLIQYAAWKGSDEVMELFFKKIHWMAIQTVLTKQTKTCGHTLLHDLIQQGKTEGTIAILSHIDELKLKEIIKMNPKNGNTLISLALEYAEPEVLKMIFEKLSVKDFGDLNQGGGTIPIGHENFILYLQKFNGSMLRDYLNCNNTLLIILKNYPLPKPLFHQILHSVPEKKTVAIISQLNCLLQTQPENVIIDFIGQYLSHEIVVHYIKNSINYDFKFLLLNPKVFAEFINHLKSEHQYFINKIAPACLQQITAYLIHESSYLNDHSKKELLQALLKRDPKATLQCIKQAWVNGAEIPLQLMKSVLPYLKPQDLFRYAWKQEIQHVENKVYPKLKPEVLSSTGASISLLNPREATQKIWEQGLRSLADYRHLKKHFPGSPMAHAVDELYRANLILTGSNCIFKFKDHPDTSALLEKAMLGETLIKMISETGYANKPLPWRDFVKQMKNYDHRAALRDETPVTRAKATHKFVHLKNEIVKYRKHTPAKAKTYTHAKKQSATLFSTTLHNSYFGEHHHNQQFVGLQFDQNHCVTKMMLSKDSGTYWRGWIGSKAKTMKYRRTIAPYNYTNKDEFHRFTNNNPHLLNEVLIKPSRESLLNIFIARDTPRARQIALERQTDIKRELDLDLPIIIYDRPCRSLRVYSEQQQRDDDVANRPNIASFNTLQAENKLQTAAKLKIQDAQQLLANLAPPDILNKLNEISQQCQTHQICWDTGLMEINAFFDLDQLKADLNKQIKGISLWPTRTHKHILSIYHSVKNEATVLPWILATYQIKKIIDEKNLTQPSKPNVALTFFKAHWKKIALGMLAGCLLAATLVFTFGAAAFGIGAGLACFGLGFSGLASALGGTVPAALVVASCPIASTSAVKGFSSLKGGSTQMINRVVPCGTPSGSSTLSENEATNSKPEIHIKAEVVNASADTLILKSNKV